MTLTRVEYATELMGSLLALQRAGVPPPIDIEMDLAYEPEPGIPGEDIAWAQQAVYAVRCGEDIPPHPDNAVQAAMDDFQARLA